MPFKKSSIVHICFLVFCFGMTAAAQNWPGVPYSYVRAGNYNLQSELHGNHQPIKNGELDSTVLHFAPKLPKASVQALLKLVNKEKQVLFDGLSECFIPHHCLIFYNSDHLPVASMSVCFECDRIDVYPKIKRKSIRKIKKKAILEAEKDMSQIKSIMLESEDAEYHEIAFFSNPEKYQQYDREMRQHPPVIKGYFKDDFQGYSLKEFKDHNDFDIGERIVENEEISAGGQSFYFADLLFDDQEDTLSFYGSEDFDGAELTKFVLTDSTLELGLPIRLGMTIERVNYILIEKSGLDVFSGMFYSQSKHPTIHIQDQKQAYFEVKLFFENSILVKIVRP